MHLKLNKSNIKSGQDLVITGSKSESNRLLILKALYPGIVIKNLSNSDDTRLMQAALSSSNSEIDIHHAGTAMRFLTAYFASKENTEVVLTGSKRMKQRPIEILVTALKDLGAEIEYLETKGCPPLKIDGKKLLKNKVGLDADVSSQYISALMLIGPSLDNGLEIFLKGKITSEPYINMTLQLLKSIGVNCSFSKNTITIENLAEVKGKIDAIVESDWSSASYYYSILALSEPNTTLELSNYKINSLQADSILPTIFRSFGVETSFMDNTIKLKKLLDGEKKSTISLNLSDSPDIAQTIAVTCFGLGLECKLNGLHTLKIKETDRLIALKTEIEKLGGNVEVNSDSLYLKSSQGIQENISIKTYNDHRMAMAFAPLALRVPILINDADVVSKSYPTYWEDLEKIGFSLQEN